MLHSMLEVERNAVGEENCVDQVRRFGNRYNSHWLLVNDRVKLAMLDALNSVASALISTEVVDGNS